MTKKFIETLTEIPGLIVIERVPASDNRGLFDKLFCIKEINSWKNRPIMQINRSETELKGVIRGLHFQQFPHSEYKLVTCLRGSVMDVALDLRKSSPTYGKTFSIKMTQSNNISLLVPAGCAHGFQTLSNNVEMIYVHSADYSAEYEDGIDSLDHTLKINWPLPCTERSERDKSLKAFNQLEDIKIEV